jgi:transposase-like protein
MSLTPLSCDGLNDYVLEFERHRRHYARPVGISWRVDETYIRVGADKQGLAVDFWLSEQRER